MTLKTLRSITIVLWLFCTILLLLPDPWVLFGRRGLIGETATAYGHLAMFVALGMFCELSRGKRLGCWNCLNILAIYGMTTEIIQYFVPFRHFDFMDWVLDCSGAFLGIHLGVLVKWSIFPMMKVARFIKSKCKRGISANTSSDAPIRKNKPDDSGNPLRSG